MYEDSFPRTLLPEEQAIKLHKDDDCHVHFLDKISQETGPAVEELGYLQIVNEVTFEVAI